MKSLTFAALALGLTTCPALADGHATHPVSGTQELFAGYRFGIAVLDVDGIVFSRIDTLRPVPGKRIQYTC